MFTFCEFSNLKSIFLHGWGWTCVYCLHLFTWTTNLKHTNFVFFFSNFMNKHQKPVLTGQRFKTRKRGRLWCVCICVCVCACVCNTLIGLLGLRRVWRMPCSPNWYGGTLGSPVSQCSRGTGLLMFGIGWLLPPTQALPLWGQNEGN